MWLWFNAEVKIKLHFELDVASEFEKTLRQNWPVTGRR